MANYPAVVNEKIIGTLKELYAMSGEGTNATVDTLELNEIMCSVSLRLSRIIYRYKIDKHRKRLNLFYLLHQKLISVLSSI